MVVSLAVYDLWGLMVVNGGGLRWLMMLKLVFLSWFQMAKGGE